MTLPLANSIPPQLADLKVYFGDANPAEARVYAQLPQTVDRADCKLTGQVTGPYCVYAHTLAVTVTMRSRTSRTSTPSNDTLLAEAILPDPCFWSPELPSLYRVQIELNRGGRVISSAEVLFGIPALGARGRDFVWQGKRWVLRGVSQKHVPTATLKQWRDMDLVIDVDEPTDELCSEASSLGVGLIARVTGDSTKLSSRLHELARYPAVILAILESQDSLDTKIRQIAPNLLLGESFAANQCVEPSPWAHVAVCADADPVRMVQRAVPCNIPIIAQRGATNITDLTHARAACDRLQADLATQTSPPISFAGYII